MHPVRLDDLLSFETAFDRDQWTHATFPPELGDLGRALSTRDWASVDPLSLKLFLSSDSSLLRIFAIQWGVASVEERFDLARRGRWLRRWEEVPGWASIPYGHYLWTFQSGLTAFFAGSLREAEARFHRAHELAQEMGYERGRMRSLFHLGLTHRDLACPGEAIEHFQRALAIARLRGATRVCARIGEQLALLEGDSGAWAAGFEAIRRNIADRIGQGDIAGARAALVAAELKRRKLGMKRRNQSLFIFLPLIAALRGKSWLAERMLARIDDPILKIRVLELKDMAQSLSETEKAELLTLKSIHGLSRASESVEVCGRLVREIHDQDLRRLILLLIESSEAVTKEQICRHVWNLAYDPVVHDGKVYKLIHRARGYFNQPKLLENCYGTYRLNRNLHPRHETRRPRMDRLRRSRAPRKLGRLAEESSGNS